MTPMASRSVTGRSSPEAPIRRRKSRAVCTTGFPDGDLMWWAEDAACKGKPTVLFFPPPSGPASSEPAKALCGSCPVREACLAYAVRTQQPDGVWGGLTAFERQSLQGPRPIVHGTTGGYQQHRRRGEKPCDSCRQANAAYKRDKALRL